MIDTIVLTLSRSMYHISNPDLFTPSARWVLTGHHKAHATQSKQNPTKKELKNGMYKPRLTISNRINALGARDVMLKIELSLPKLLLEINKVLWDVQKPFDLITNCSAIRNAMWSSFAYPGYRLASLSGQPSPSFFLSIFLYYSYLNGMPAKIVSYAHQLYAKAGGA